ncbi:radical SAM family heme chaperone HemW [Fluviibacterium sp. DFM31]|uniref:Heme chaperone HemW n=1 Tax=Meridianimarinicoccus marinus TaxID=3231483 RepID=A0ABV3L9F5_9RHOB
MTERPDWEAGGFGLYIHWPFCAAKCPYCDFNSHVAATIDHTRWRKAYLAELRRAARETHGRVLNTVFFGGGTPSLMDPGTVAAILDEVRRLWPMANDPEITLEANPTSVEAGKFRAFRQGGITRVSMGVQSLRDDDLRRLGRMHSVAEARQAFDIARKEFDRVSFDMIYARQGQTREGWSAELTEALSMAVDHLSAYQLTIEPGTAFGDRYARGKLRDLPDDDLSADLYDLTQEICTAHGMPAYEVSNHAAPGSESRHNLIYWRYGDYIGIGPGAHGRVTTPEGRMASETHLAPGAWLQAVEQRGTGETLRSTLPAADQAAEYLMMSLRLSEGSDLSRLARLDLAPDAARLSHLQELGLVALTGSRLRATQAGRRVLNGVLRELLMD